MSAGFEPGTIEVFELVVALVLKPVLGLAIVGWDERRTAETPEIHARGWPPASRLSAVVVFQELGVLLHFWRTRRWHPYGLLAGVAAAALVLLGTGVVLELLDLALGGEG